MNAKDRPVNGPDGYYGTVDTTCWPSLDEKTDVEVDLQLHGGRHVAVPADALIEQKDGSYYLALHRKDLEAKPQHDKPVVDRQGWPCPIRSGVGG